MPWPEARSGARDQDVTQNNEASTDMALAQNNGASTDVSLAVEARSANSKGSSTPTRMRRRIIGGVVRTPASQDLRMPSASPQSDFNATPRHHSKSSQKLAKEAPMPFRIDLSDHTAGECTVSRSAGLTRSYGTLGVQSHRIIKQHPQLAASASAMTLDLGQSRNSPVSSWIGASPPSLGKHMPFSNQDFSRKPFSFHEKMCPSASLGSLPTVNKVKGGRLPALFLQNSVDSIASTLLMSKTTTKWCNTGLRGSASMIF